MTVQLPTSCSDSEFIPRFLPMGGIGRSDLAVLRRRGSLCTLETSASRPHSPKPNRPTAKDPRALSDGEKTSAGWYLTSVATFMIPAGIQMVLLPDLLAIELHQPAARYGVTQIFGQLPILLVLLFGGSLAGR